MAVRGKEDAGDGKRAAIVVEGGRAMALKEDVGSDKGSNDRWLYIRVEEDGDNDTNKGDDNSVGGSKTARS
ncbi:hypothetical protein B296_00013229 [Ensete ventricosum]|uniref:Uncharacterized protein n=1 Tax=Ensete ventricosum TaxID=4639 RepID=A0A427AVK7_ENSVE|nr:hypothetical protein B296_00013229 [Ensete ventricosum]